MKRRFYLLFLPLLAVCAAGCGKKSTADEESSSAPAEEPGFDSAMRKGVAGVAQKDADAASAAAAKALEIRPESAEAHLLAGQAACLRKDFDAARAQFSSIINTSLPAPLRAKAYVGLGTVDFAQGKNDMSHVAFLQARRLDDQNEAAWYYLGSIYKEKGFKKPAEDCFRKFIDLSEQSQPGNSRAKNVREKIIPEISRAAAQARASGGNATKAAQLVQQVSPLVQQAHEKKKPLTKAQVTKAKKNYEEALKLDPQSHVAALGYARLLKLEAKTVEEKRKAVRAYGVAIALNPDDLLLYKEARDFAYPNKFYMQTVQIMERAIAYHPQTKDLIDILDVLIGALRRVGITKLANAWCEYRDGIKPAKP